jgi:hypothetical protein
MSEEQWDAMFGAQCTWDATMGFNAVKALQQHGGSDAIMMVSSDPATWRMTRAERQLHAGSTAAWRRSFRSRSRIAEEPTTSGLRRMRTSRGDCA